MFGGFYFGQAYFGESGNGALVSTGASVATFSGFGGGVFGPESARKRKKKKKCEEDEPCPVPSMALQSAMLADLQANAPPLPDTATAFKRKAVTRAGPTTVDPAILRKRRIEQDDDELMMILRS